MGNRQMIFLEPEKLLKLIRGEEVMVLVEEVYYDLDAEDYLLTGKSIDDVIIKVNDK